MMVPCHVPLTTSGATIRASSVSYRTRATASTATTEQTQQGNSNFDVFVDALTLIPYFYTTMKFYGSLLGKNLTQNPKPKSFRINDGLSVLECGISASRHSGKSGQPQDSRTTRVSAKTLLVTGSAVRHSGNSNQPK